MANLSLKVILEPKSKVIVCLRTSLQNFFDFEITSNDEFIFFEYFDSGKIKSVHKGKVNYIEEYASPHLKITNLNPEHQIVDKEPLLVRGNWSFYYVFKSKKFGNMFFKKKKLVFYKF